MSDTDTDSFFSKHLCYITRMAIREGESKYSEAIPPIFRSDKPYLVWERGDLRQGIFDQILFIYLNGGIPSDTFDILESCKE